MEIKNISYFRFLGRLSVYMGVASYDKYIKIKVVIESDLDYGI
jgi:hypothetical protein